MILTTILLAAAAVTTGALVISFWDEIKSWVTNRLQNLIKMVKGIVYGVKLFMKLMNEAYQQVVKTYHKDENKVWHETMTTREIPKSEVPSEISSKVKINNKEIDITSELERELELIL